MCCVLFERQRQCVVFCLRDRGSALCSVLETEAVCCVLFERQRQCCLRDRQCVVFCLRDSVLCSV